MLYNAAERFLWVMFLLLIVALPIPFGAFDNVYWSFFGLVTALLLASYLLLQLVCPRGTFRALRSARVAVSLMVLQSVYVLCQRLITHSGQRYPDAPAWFSQEMSFWTLQPGATMAWLAQSCLYITLFVLALCLVNSRQRVRAAIYCIIGSAVFHALLGIAGKLQSIHLVPLAEVDGHFDVSRGLFVNRNHFAALLNYGLAMLMTSAFYALYKRVSYATGWRQRTRDLLDALLSRQLLWWGVLAVLLLALSFSTSRAALLGFVGALGLLTVYVSVVDRALGNALRWYAVMVLAVLAVLLLTGSDGVLQRVTQGALDVGERAEQWQQTLAAIQQYWLLGSGAGTYADAFQWHRSLDDLRQLVYDQAHNMYLHNWLEQGLVGLLLWLAAYVAIFARLVSGYRSSRSDYVKAVVLGCVLALTMALLQAVVDFNLLIPALNAYFYCIAAIGIAAAALYRDTPTSRSTQTKPLADTGE